MKIKMFWLIAFLIVKQAVCSQKPYDNILLIINYNHAHYDSVQFFKDIYKPYFENIVFYGPEAYQEVHPLNNYRGYFSYLAIADAMIRYPNFDGYFFLMDDCILNAWLLPNFDQSKIWFSENEFMYSARGNPINIKAGKNAFSQWSWWNTQWGYESIKKAYEKIPKKYKKKLAQNWGKSRVVAAFSDFAYVPAKYNKDFIELATIFRQFNVFLELGLPTILSCLGSKSEWIWLDVNSTYRPPYHEAYKDFKLDSYFNHPIKLSFELNRRFVTKIFDEMQKK